MNDDTRRRFERDMVRVYERARDEAGYNATYFLRMLGEHGGLGTARRLLASSTVSEGFSALWERRRLDLTVEALALRPEYAELFTDEELETARQRLRRLYARVAADLAAAGLPDGSRVLDAGTGPGRVPLAIAEAAPGLRVEGIDLSEEMIEYARGVASPSAS